MPTNDTARRTAGKLAGVIVLAGVIGGLPVAVASVRAATDSIASAVTSGLHLRHAAWFGGCGETGSVCPIGAAVFPSTTKLSGWCTLDADGVKNCRV